MLHTTNTLPQSRTSIPIPVIPHRITRLSTIHKSRTIAYGILISGQQHWLRHCVISQASEGPADKVSIEELFAAELANRQAVEAHAAEAAAAAVFDGPALLALLRKKYGRSYDVSLVQRTYLGKAFVALNIMWKYMEQQSFSYSEEQYMQRLEYVAAALVSWGVVTSVQSQLAATKERPRVGKAVSIMLDVPQEQAREWIAG